jgi:hypothetical protein
MACSQDAIIRAVIVEARKDRDDGGQEYYYNNTYRNMINACNGVMLSYTDYYRRNREMLLVMGNETNLRDGIPLISERDSRYNAARVPGPAGRGWANHGGKLKRRTRKSRKNRRTRKISGNSRGRSRTMGRNKRK